MMMMMMMMMIKMFFVFYNNVDWLSAKCLQHMWLHVVTNWLVHFVAGITQPTWKQVVLEPSKIIVDGEVTFLGLSNNKMETSYSTDPFAN